MKKRMILALAVLIATVASSRAADAKQNWDKICAKCHGPDGKGNTPMGKKLRIVDHTDPKTQAKYTDEQMFKAIKEGVKDEKGSIKMKANREELTDEEIKTLVAYVRTLKK